MKGAPKKPLDPHTLRWAARKASRYERELRQFQHESPDRKLHDLYERAATTAFVLKATYLSQARVIERKRKPRKP
jgi:hypothetical protein